MDHSVYETGPLKGLPRRAGHSDPTFLFHHPAHPGSMFILPPGMTPADLARLSPAIGDVDLNDATIDARPLPADAAPPAIDWLPERRPHRSAGRTLLVGALVAIGWAVAVWLLQHVGLYGQPDVG